MFCNFNLVNFNFNLITWSIKFNFNLVPKILFTVISKNLSLFFLTPLFYQLHCNVFSRFQRTGISVWMSRKLVCCFHQNGSICYKISFQTFVCFVQAREALNVSCLLNSMLFLWWAVCPGFINVDSLLYIPYCF